MEKNRVGLKVTGIVFAIIAVVAILAVVFSITVLPIMKYNVAKDNASSGNYALAVEGLYELDYKDSDSLLQEYALEAGKDELENGDAKKALVYFGIAIECGENELIADEAKSLYESNNK